MVVKKVYGPIEVKGKIPVKDLEASNVYVKLLGDRERVMADIDTPQHGVKGELLTLKGIDDAIDDLEKNVIKKRNTNQYDGNCIRVLMSKKEISNTYRSNNNFLSKK